MKTLFCALALMSLALASASASADERGDARRCSNASLKGTYLYSGEGMTLLAVPLPNGYPYFPYIEVGLEIYDGVGNVQNIYSNSQEPGHLSDTATYVVNPNCEGTVTYSSGSVFSIFLGPNGDSFTFIQADDSSRIYSGQQQRVADTTNPRCSNRSLRGTYTYFAQGSDNHLFFYLQTGMETYDGQGNVKNKYVDSLTRTMNFDTATYEVGANCAGVARYASGDIFNVFASPADDSFVYVQVPNGRSILTGSQQRVSRRVIDILAE